jgi:Rap1a immunity proteins
MRAVLLGLLADALLATNADAQKNLQSANYMVPACQNFLANRNTTNLVDLVDQGICIGTLNGLSYLARYLPPHLSSCAPTEATTGQKIRVVLAYIQRRPQRMHEDFQDLAIEAFHEAWPCKAAP